MSSGTPPHACLPLTMPMPMWISLRGKRHVTMSRARQACASLLGGKLVPWRAK